MCLVHSLLLNLGELVFMKGLIVLKRILFCVLYLYLFEFGRLKNILRGKLIECGWRDEMKDLAKDVIRSRGGVSKTTVDELVSEILPRGRASVPDKVKKSLMASVRDFASRDV